MARDERFRTDIGKKARITNNSWLLRRPIAHRGLHGDEIPENSLTAFQVAAAHGHPIELDVRLTKDGELVVFHDGSLRRMTGAEGNVSDLTLAELRRLRLAGTDQVIPTFRETLDLIRGKVPILVEIKSDTGKEVADRTVEALAAYRGEVAVQSFDPRVIRRVKKLAPRLFRGILATADAADQSFFRRFVLKHMSLNFLIRPDFISYDLNGLPLPQRKIKNKALLAWTVRSRGEIERAGRVADNYIFEHVVPR